MRRSCKTLSVLITLLLMIGVFTSGCSDTPDAKTGDKEFYVIGFSQLGSESDWRIANTKSMSQTFTNDNGYELIIENAKQQQDNQFAAIRRFILEGVDLIVIAPTIEEGWDMILNEVQSAGIPVIIIDRSVAVRNDDLYLTNIGSDFLHQGELAVEWLEDQTSDSEYVNILHLQGTYGATAQLMRTKAIEDAESTHSNWKIVAQLYGDFTEAKGYEVMTEYLKKNKDIDVLYSENDNMTFGAMRALDEAGITYGENGQVKIITFDATKTALQYCLDGKISLCVECNPMHGPLVEQLIKRYRSGETIPKHVFIDEAAFTREDLTQEMVEERDY
ncbi:simple sugar transport system substrate-binding protein [Ruminococcaceae bacterium YRB3002]|nr:simple sugar transport system substrate-binding protein [Ruminococcaceae bacterium YRB3002]